MPLLFSICFIVQLKITQHWAKEKLEYSMLQTLHLQKEDFKWEKEGKEIRFRDKLFDVKTYHIKDDQFHFTGLFDDDETALIKNLKNDIGKNSEQENQLLSKLFQLLQSVYGGNSADILISNNNPDADCYIILSKIPSPIKNIPTPPPQL